VGKRERKREGSASSLSPDFASHGNFRDGGRNHIELELTTVADGTIIDTKGWKGWEWTHGIALTALINVSL
jgi:hypothetical protein